jgi:hypothetical protein
MMRKISLFNQKHVIARDVEISSAIGLGFPVAEIFATCTVYQLL